MGQSAHRRKIKRLFRLQEETPKSQYSAVANAWMKSWCVEIRRRADLLGAPAAWAFLEDPELIALVKELDPDGKLSVMEDLQRFVVEAIAAVSDKHLGRLSKPSGVAIRRN